MRIYDVIWKERFAEKIADKHGLTIDEVEQVLFSKPHVRLAERDVLRVKICTQRTDRQRLVGTSSYSMFVNGGLRLCLLQLAT